MTTVTSARSLLRIADLRPMELDALLELARQAALRALITRRWGVA